MATYEQIEAAARAIRERVGEAEIGVILGSGLGDYAQALTDAKYIDYRDIPGFPVSTAPGHAGRWWTGTVISARLTTAPRPRDTPRRGWRLQRSA